MYLVLGRVIHFRRKKSLETRFMSNKILVSIILILFSILTEGVFAMEITSTAFNNGEIIPAKYTCDGDDISPPLAWSGIPPATKSIALICDDPDATNGTWTHWVLYNIPPTSSALPENVHTFPSGTKVGVNSWPRKSYGGPCPPSGVHRYFFKLFALDTTLNLHDKITSDQLQAAMVGHILDKAILLGKYQRKK